MKKAVLIAVAIALAGPLGFFAQQLLRRAPVVTAAPPASAAAATAAPTEDASAAEEAAAQKIPDVLPKFLLADRDGKKRSLQEWSGHPLMVNFWATWCPPCRKEIPLLNQVRARHAAQKLEIVGIAVDFKDDVLEYAKKTAISYPLLIGEEDGLAAMKALGMEGAGFPFTFFADSRQRIVAMKLGELHQDEADFILDRVMGVDSGKLTLAQAKEQIDEGMQEITTRRKITEAAEAAKKPAGQ